MKKMISKPCSWFKRSPNLHPGLHPSAVVRGSKEVVVVEEKATKKRCWAMSMLPTRFGFELFTVPRKDMTELQVALLDAYASRRCDLYNLTNRRCIERLVEGVRPYTPRDECRTGIVITWKGKDILIFGDEILVAELDCDDCRLFVLTQSIFDACYEVKQ